MTTTPLVVFRSTEDVLTQMKTALEELGSTFVSKVDGVMTFDLAEAGTWTLDLKTGPVGRLVSGTSADATLTVVVSNESDFLALASGTLSPEQAFLNGQIKVRGSMALAMKLKTVFDATRTAGPTVKTAVETLEVKKSKLKSSVIFRWIEKAILANGAELVNKANGVFQFHIISTTKGEPDGTWLLDLKNGSGSLTTDTGNSAEITITISDDDFVALSRGKLNPQMAYMRGKLKIKGKMGLALKLGNVFKAAARPQSKL